MANPAVINVFSPQSSAGYYATNNQFQCTGPKGFTQFKLLENSDLYLRADLPGVVNETMRCWTDPTKKLVLFSGEAPKESEHDESHRSYFALTGLICDCCEISAINSDVKDGVVRMLLQKVKIKKSKKKPCPVHSIDGWYDSGESGFVLEDHPFVTEGPKQAFEAKPTKDGGLYMRVDMPGVANKDAIAWIQNGEVRFFGRAKKMDHDKEGRDYCGNVSLCSNISKIQFEMKNGVLRITIPSA